MSGVVGLILAPIIALVVICGCWKCSRIGLRSCCCCKKLLLCLGCDKFEDFEILVLVHETTYTATTKKLNAHVEVKAGSHVVKTDPSQNGIYQQPVSVFVEQGTKEIEFILVDGKKKVANMKIKVETIIFAEDSAITDKVYSMKEINKGLVSPQIRLTFVRNPNEGAGQGLLSELHVSSGVEAMLLKQMQESGASPRLGPSSGPSSGSELEKPSELELFAKGCQGPLTEYLDWGRKAQVYACVLSPPEVKRHTFVIYQDKSHCEKRSRPKHEIEVLKIQGVAPDPSRSEVFIIQYVDANKRPRRIHFERIDRATNVWIEMLELLIKKVHEQLDDKKALHLAHKHAKK